MRLLYLHSDFMEYKPISKEIKDAGEIFSNGKVKFEDLVVTLVAVENGDNERVLNEATEDVRKYLSTVKSRTVLIYPYAHLSSNLAVGPLNLLYPFGIF
jgi:threonyl-tRNA synthetase